MKKLFALILALLMIFSLVACGQKEEAAPSEKEEAAAPAEKEEAAPAEEDDGLVIGYSLGDLNAAFFEAEKVEAERLAAELGIEIIVTVADGDTDKQNSQIEDLITRGVDAICCVPQDTNAILSAVDACAEAGVPFVAVGRPPADLTNVSYSILADEVICGEMGAVLIAERAEAAGIDQVRVIEMIGDYSDMNAVNRQKGFEAKAEELGFEIVGTVSTEWNADTAYNRFNDLVTTGVEFNAVYLPSDMLIPSTISVLEQHGLFFPVGEEGHVIVTGTDGETASIQAILDGKTDGVVNADAFVCAREGIMAAKAFAEGNPPAGDSMIIELMLVHTDNVEQLVADQAIWGAMGIE